MRYATVCSGIEAPSVAWPSWDPVFFSEVEAYPKAVLKHHYPNVPDLGDMTQINGKDYHGTIDLILGGTPCQGFSNAGKRRGLDDERSGLAFHFTRLVEEIQPRWVVWENVPGCFSCWSDEENGSTVCEMCGSGSAERIIQGNDFQAFTSELVKCGYHLAYRVLDAQYFGVPQRRRRIFVVGYLGDWRPATAVLFERPSMSRNPKQGKKAGEEIARAFEIGPGGVKQSEVSHTMDCRSKNGPMQNQVSAAIVEPLTTRPYSDRGAADESKLIVGALCSNGKAAGSATQQDAENDMLICCDSRQDPDTVENLSLPLNANLPVHAIAFQTRFVRNGRGAPSDIVPALTAQAGGTGKGDSAPCVADGMTVRRLTPMECERLQGFPDGYTDIPFGNKPKYGALCADSHRYKALGNSIAVPVLEWIGKRIEMVEEKI